MTEIEKVRKIRKLLLEMGFSFRILGKDPMVPVILGSEFYDMLMDTDQCKNLIDKLRQYKLKAFK